MFFCRPESWRKERKETDRPATHRITSRADTVSYLRCTHILWQHCCVYSMFLLSRQVFVSYGDSWKSQTHNFVCCSFESVLVFCKCLTFLLLICFTWFTGIVKAWERHVIMWRELIKFSTLRPALLHFDFHLHCSLLSQINLSKKVDFGTARGLEPLVVFDRGILMKTTKVTGVTAWHFDCCCQFLAKCDSVISLPFVSSKKQRRSELLHVEAAVQAVRAVGVFEMVEARHENATKCKESKMCQIPASSLFTHSSNDSGRQAHPAARGMPTCTRASLWRRWSESTTLTYIYIDLYRITVWHIIYIHTIHIYIYRDHNYELCILCSLQWYGITADTPDMHI